MYPTGLVILTAFTKSYLERTIEYDSLPNLQFAILPSQRAMDQIAICEEDIQ